MRGMGPNLAGRPFVNERPVKRTTMLIWVVASALLTINIFLYQRHLSGQYEQRAALKSLQQNIAAEESALQQLEDELSNLELGRQNEKVVFLNGQIAKRKFSWGQLFERLEEVLPANVQLRRVSPRILAEKDRDSRLEGEHLGELVAIDMNGYAQSTEELLQLVDRLFEHPSFAIPNLMNENERDDRRLDFALDVLYLPSAFHPEVDEASTGSSEEEG